MRRPLWFRRHGFHWTPCAWQGWGVVVGYTLVLLALILQLAPRHPYDVVWIVCAMTVVMIAIAVNTDDTHRSES